MLKNSIHKIWLNWWLNNISSDVLCLWLELLLGSILSDYKTYQIQLIWNIILIDYITSGVICLWLEGLGARVVREVEAAPLTSYKLTNLSVNIYVLCNDLTKRKNQIYWKIIFKKYSFCSCSYFSYKWLLTD